MLSSNKNHNRSMKNTSNNLTRLPQIEFERKYRITDLKGMRDNLIELGAMFQDNSHCEDIYFKIVQKVKRTKYLRVRMKNKSVQGTLAYHEVVNDFETKEWEVAVDDAQMIIEILLNLGFKYDVIVIKQREKLIFENSEIVLDEVKDLGCFVEIESPNRVVFERLIEKLNIKNADIISGVGYPDLLKSFYKKSS
jgi:predicted adenylyl cyclase CyaB